MKHSRIEDYAPLSVRALDRVLEFDRGQGFGPKGTQQNRTRFYLYLTQNGSDVQIRTVAVKAAKRWEWPVAKEVVRTSVDDPWMWIKDLGFAGMGGYQADWTPEGFGTAQYWDYQGRWESEAYALRCMWKMYAPVVNPEMLKRTKRFKWHAWEPGRGHLLDYLKIYTDHPEIELLSKQGLGRFSTKVSVIRKLKKDQKFRQFFAQHADAIKHCGFGVTAIMKAYSKGITLAHAQQIIDARNRFRGDDLPLTICALKALRYIEKQRISPSTYTNYLHDCESLEMDLSDTKVIFPNQFNVRAQAVKDQVDTIRRKADAAKRRKMNRKIADIAEEWSWLEQLRGTYRIKIPRTEAAFVAEGKALANCLGGQYAAKVARGEILIVFVRRSRRMDESFVAVEYNLQQGIVTQCYGLKNSKPPKQVEAFVERAFEGVGSAQLQAVA